MTDLEALRRALQAPPDERFGELLDAGAFLEHVDFPWGQR